jgi:Fur family ferric uptake transcriptional regulator
MPPNPIDLLLAHGLQVTPQRLTVLRVVTAHPHVTAERVAELVRAEIGAISRQAVYNVLGVLVEKGVLRKIQPLGSPSLFEARVGDNHHHLICRACGRVVDIDCAVGAAPCLQVPDDRGYRIDEAEVIYWGHCPSCLDAAGSQDAPARSGPDHHDSHDGQADHERRR